SLDNYKTLMSGNFQRYLDLKRNIDNNNEEITEDIRSEYEKLKEKFGNYKTLDSWLEAQSKDENSDWYLLQNKTYYGWDVDSLLYAIQDSIINREEGSTVTPKAAEDANIKARNVYIKAGGGIGRDEGYTVLDISNLQSKEGIEVLKQIAAAEASDVKWGYDGNIVDANKATINNVNSICIDSKGTLEAYAKGNIYFEDVNNNSINLVSVASDEGNVRVYGSNGVYNATNYVEGNKNNTINLSGKDLILEAGNGSIGSSTVPVTTNMSGVVTLRSDGLINIYQIGGYALTFAAAYSGADMNIRCIGDILSVYSGVQSQDLGYINAKGSISLLSDKGNIGEANGKGLRVKIAEGQLLNAEADSIYINGQGDNKNLALGQFKARKGDIGIESKLWDVFLKNNISANNIELIVRSLTQLSGKLTVNNLLKVISDNGIMLSNAKNHIPEAYIVNNKSGVVGLNTDTDLTLHKAINLAVDSAMTIFANGSINSLDFIESFGSLLIWSKGNINSSNDLMAKDWMGLYAENGGINVKGGLTANAIDLSVDENGLTADGIYSDSYIKANVELGDIIINGNVKATEGSIDLVTELGDVKFDNVEAKEDIKVAAYFGKELEFKTINSKEGSVEAVSFGSLTGDSINAGKDFYVASILDLNLNKLVGGPSDSDTLSYLFGKNVKIDSITVDNKFEAISEKLDVNDIKITGNTKIDSYYDININKINVDGDLSFNSIGDYELGNINIKEINNFNGNLILSNEKGDIDVDSINSGGNVYISSFNKGNIYINDNITTTNGGSLYTSIEQGYLLLSSGNIDGEGSFYSEDGDIQLLELKVKDELDVRAKYGSISLGYKTYVGKDATLQSDSEDVVLADAEVGGNLRLIANNSAIIFDANVGGSMLIKGAEEGCYANALTVGKDLIANTNSGNIKIIDALVGEDTYVSIDDDGGSIDIEKIKTGINNSGDLIVSSKSLLTDNDNDFDNEKKYVRIQNAVASNKI
ncbi:MAG: hypothetical protein II567_09225, partial [Candidatus Riflebacteria bacterium]|nr:hypothetical protein [Candidatus Riflebacteria bacterium]